MLISAVKFAEADQDGQTKCKFGGNEARLTVDAESLTIAQKIHAFAILVLPIFGTTGAVLLAIRHGIGRIEIGSLVLMYSVSWIGITVGYHRHFTHRSFKAVAPVRLMLGVFGSIACQGPVNYWVSNHRRHHQYSDRPGDIHSPYISDGKKIGLWRGFIHSHVGWTFNHEITNTAVVAKDIMTDRLVGVVHRLYYLWLILGFVAPAVLGGIATQTWEGAMLGMLWGGFVRLFLCYHSTNTITSLTHMFGSRPFKSHDQSRNNMWLAIPTWGEAWHNNHHSFPTSPIFGLRWWQVDLGGLFIRFLQVLRLVSAVNKPRPQMLATKARVNAS